MFKVFDAHCDTADVLYDSGLSLKKNNFHIDRERMFRYDKYLQVYAAYIDKDGINCSPMNRCIALLEKIHKELDLNNIPVIKNREELKFFNEYGKLGAILSIEGGEALEGNISALWMYYNLGVRLITLTWNYANELADGITEPRGGGLTQFGKEAVSMMEELGIMVDVSHLSVKGFWDVAEITSKPFIASHSCVKTLCHHPRNLDDEQIKYMIKNGCGIGINYYPQFLSDTADADISKIIEHIEYIVDMGGGKNVGLGSDYDGIEKLADGIEGIQNTRDIIKIMKKHGFSDEQAEDISYKNFYRIFGRCLSDF